MQLPGTFLLVLASQEPISRMLNETIGPFVPVVKAVVVLALVLLVTSFVVSVLAVRAYLVRRKKQLYHLQCTSCGARNRSSAQTCWICAHELSPDLRTKRT